MFPTYSGCRRESNCRRRDARYCSEALRSLEPPFELGVAMLRSLPFKATAHSFGAALLAPLFASLSARQPGRSRFPYVLSVGFQVQHRTLRESRDNRNRTRQYCETVPTERLTFRNVCWFGEVGKNCLKYSYIWVWGSGVFVSRNRIQTEFFPKSPYVSFFNYISGYILTSTIKLLTIVYSLISI